MKQAFLDEVDAYLDDINLKVLPVGTGDSQKLRESKSTGRDIELEI